MQKENDLQYLLNLRENRSDNKREWQVKIENPLYGRGCLSVPYVQNALLDEGFEDDAALDETIKKLEQDLKKARKKEVEGQDEPTVCPFTSVTVPLEA